MQTSDNNNAQSIIDNETGYRRDLREAEQIVATSGDDPVRMALGLRRHAEAERNMVIAEIIPSFEKALKPLLNASLDDKLSPVVAGIGGLQLGVTQLNSDFQAISDIVNQLVLDMGEGKTDRASLHLELSNVKTDVHGVKHDVALLSKAIADIRDDFYQYRMGSRRSEIDTIQQQLKDLQGEFAPEERIRLTQVLLAMIKEYEETHFSDE